MLKATKDTDVGLMSNHEKRKKMQLNYALTEVNS